MLLFYLTSTAQNIAVGLKLGYTSSFPSVNGNTLYGENVKTSSLGGVVAALFVNVPVAKSFVIRPEFSFTSKGANLEYTNSGIPTFMDRARLNYFELPVNFLYQYKIKSGTLLFGGGPVASFPTGRQYSYSISYGNKKTDIGINAMAAFEIPPGFSININYTHGFTDIADKTIQDNYWKNRNISVTLGYLF